MSWFLVDVVLVLLACITFVVALGLHAEVQLMTSRKSGIGSELPTNSRAPTFVATDVRANAPVDSSTLTPIERILLFISPHCGICRGLVQSLGSVDRRSLIVVCHGEKTECLTFTEQLQPDVPLLVDPIGAISDRYGALSNPAAVFVSARNRIRGYGFPRTGSELLQLWQGVLPPETFATTSTEASKDKNNALHGSIGR